MQNHVVIMAGGIGSRFWPMSTPEYPKQFMDVLGTGRTLIQMTADRFSAVCPPENMWVVTSESYAGIVREQLPFIPGSNILAEPAARNTAPCIAYACWKIRASIRGGENANIVVTPSDALVTDTTEYRRVINDALEFTSGSGAIVTVGIKPTRPETGYGYIHASGSGCPAKVLEFREKPDIATAQSFLADGGYLWNAGIFVWTLDTITKAIRTHAPQIAGVMDSIAADGFSAESVKSLFPTCEKISIDYAVMEKSKDIYTIPGDFGWSDLGTWGSLKQNSKHDKDGNAIIGTGISTFNCKDCVVHVSDLKQVVLEGLDGYIVAEKDGRLLVCRLSEEQHIKEMN